MKKMLTFFSISIDDFKLGKTYTPAILRNEKKMNITVTLKNIASTPRCR